MPDTGALRCFETGHDHDRLVWPAVAKLIGQVCAVERARHSDVGEQQTDIVRVLLQVG
ncbi:hypothetical protein D3C73_1650440 [compost metagenome]